MVVAIRWGLQLYAIRHLTKIINDIEVKPVFSIPVTLEDASNHWYAICFSFKYTFQNSFRMDNPCRVSFTPSHSYCKIRDDIGSAQPCLPREIAHA